jgi:hypothetical protein
LARLPRRFQHVPFGFGSLGDSRSRPGHHVAVRLVGRVRLVVLEPGRELGVPKDLLNAARHRHHLKSFSGARVACTITTSGGFRYAWRVVDPCHAPFGRSSPGSDSAPPSSMASGPADPGGLALLDPRKVRFGC